LILHIADSHRDPDFRNSRSVIEAFQHADVPRERAKLLVVHTESDDSVPDFLKHFEASTADSAINVIRPADDIADLVAASDIVLTLPHVAGEAVIEPVFQQGKILIATGSANLVAG